MGGNTMDGIIHAYRYLTGKAQMLCRSKLMVISNQRNNIHYFQKKLGDCTPLQRNQFRWIVWFRLNTWDPGNWGRRFWIILLWG